MLERRNDISRPDGKPMRQAQAANINIQNDREQTESNRTEQQKANLKIAKLK